MRRLFIVSNTIDGISALIVNRLLHRKYTDVIVLNKKINDFDHLNSYNSITCIDVIPFSEDKFNELLNSSKKVHVFVQNAPEWLFKYNHIRTVHINKNHSSSLSYYNTICYDIPILEYYLNNLSDIRFKSIFARKCYMDYIDTIVHRITKIIYN